MKKRKVADLVPNVEERIQAVMLEMRWAKVRVEEMEVYMRRKETSLCLNG